MEILAVYDVVDIVSPGVQHCLFGHMHKDQRFNTICSDPFLYLDPSWEQRESAVALADIIDTSYFQMLALSWFKNQIPILQTAA